MLCYRKHSFSTKKYQIFKSEGCLLIGQNIKNVKYTINLNLKTVIQWSMTPENKQLNGFFLICNKQWKFFEMDAKTCELLKCSLGCSVCYRKFQKLYEPIHLISSGSFGSLIKMRSIFNGENVFGKTIKKSLQYTFQDFSYQIDILNNLYHKHIHKIKEVYWSNKSFHFITSFPEGGSLTNYIKTQEYENQDIIIIMKIILSTIQYIHEKGYIHRDLKPDNIFLMKQNNIEELVISEFDFACKTLDILIKHPNCGTHGFLAPEVRLQKYDAKCDIFSCGVILYQLLTKRELFDHETYHYDEKMMLHLIIHSNIHCQFQNILKLMLQFDPSKRITINDCLTILDDFNESEQTPQRSPIFDEMYFQTSLNEDQVISLEEKSDFSDLSSNIAVIQCIPTLTINKKQKPIY